MPNWRFHLITGGLVTVFLIYLCNFIGLRYLFIDDDEVRFFFWFQICFITLLGSILPDFDYRKTRIRHGLGLALGGFLIISYIYVYGTGDDNVNANTLLLVLLGFIIVTFIIGLVFPFKHHGKLHSFTAALVFSLLWFVLELGLFEQSIIEAGMVSAFGLLGYISHLILDRDLKMW